MLQEGSPSSLPLLRLLGDRRERKKRKRATDNKKRSRRRRRWEEERGRKRETSHLAGNLPCNLCCYILFVCFWGTLRTSPPPPPRCPRPPPSSPPIVLLPSSSPFLPRVRPHLDPGIWVRLYVYNLLRRRAHRGYLVYPRTSFVGCTIRKLNYTPVPDRAGMFFSPSSRNFNGEKRGKSRTDRSCNIARSTWHVRSLLVNLSFTRFIPDRDAILKLSVYF